MLPPGSVTPFLFPSSQNCDSVVTVTVTALQPSASTVNLSACFGSVATYNGVDIPAGASQTFTLDNWVGCDSTVTVQVASLPVTVQFVDAVACANEFFTFNGQQLAPGTQTTFTAVNASGCVDTTFVAVFGLPTSTGTATLTACPGTTVTYAGVTLSPGDVQDVTLTNWLNCDSVVTVTVLATQSDTTQLSLQVCEGETLDYNGQQLAAGETFTWVGTNQAGCDSVVIVSVSALPVVSFDLSASQICWNALDGSISVGNVSGSSAPYQYSLNGVNFQPDAFFEGLPPGDYTVFLQDQNGCVFEENIGIPVTPPMSLQVADETLVCGSEVLLSPVAISDLPLTWEWRDSSGVIGTSPEISVSTPGLFTFTATNACETASGQVVVTVESLSVNRLIYLPNSFSPNNDGINDCYRGYVAPDLDIVSYELKIFDRWGDQMFETTDIEGCWDGILRGKQLDPAVMVYWMTLRVRNCDGVLEEVFRKGDIHLVR